MTYTQHKRLDVKLKDEAWLLHELVQISRVEPPGSMFYIEPTFHGIYSQVCRAVIASNNKQRNGMMMKSSFKVESKIGEQIQVLKIRNEKQDLLLAEFNFHKSTATNANS